MQPSSVTDILFKQLNFSAERQKVISSNIANIDTPNYKTRDIKFKDQLLKSSEADLPLSLTHKAHMQVGTIGGSKPYSVYEVKNLEEQNDGNNVNLDTQMAEQSKNSVLFNALQNSIKKDSMWFKTMIDSSSKN